MLRQVPNSVDFRRVAALPRRRLDRGEAEAISRHLTPHFRAPGSRAELLAWQGPAILEFVENRGALCWLPVGTGKTLITYLAALAIGAKRPVLVTSASLREKTRRTFASYVGQWRSPTPPPRFVSRESLQTADGATLLDRLRPDAMFIDECDELSNRESSAALRIDRYLTGSPEGEACAVMALTGTPIRKSLMGTWHIMCWCLRERAPVPLTESEALTWAAAIDECGPRGCHVRTVRPGVLGATVAAARAWVAQRWAETPGLLIVDEDSCDQPLQIRTIPAREDPILDEAFATFLRTQETPRGLPVTDPLSRWRLDGFLGCGLLQYYDPPPPPEWTAARRALARFVRDKIRDSQRTTTPLDTEGRVLAAYREHPIVAEWRRVRGLFDPAAATQVEWITDSALRSAEDWLREVGVGIVWVGSVEFGAALAERTGLRFYQRDGRDARTRQSIVAAPVGVPFVASWHANKRGLDLQAWPRQCVVYPPQSARYLEQLFGRGHRHGQTRPVQIDVIATSGGTLDALESALREAEFGRELVTLTQKLLRADVEHVTPRETRGNRYRWARKPS